MENGRVHHEQLTIGDAFGEILLACQQAGGAFGVAHELVERSDGFLAVADAARYFSTDLDAAFDLVSGRVLDIGAGAGRASVALHDRGQDVVALDISQGATAVCRDRGVPTTFTGTVFELAESRPEPFDTFLMLGNNLGLSGGPTHAPLVLEARGAMATPGARIVGETADPYTTTRPVHLDYPRAEPKVWTPPGTAASSHSLRADRYAMVGLPALHPRGARGGHRSDGMGLGRRAATSQPLPPVACDAAARRQRVTAARRAGPVHGRRQRAP